jgi:hypothetical protein
MAKAYPFAGNTIIALIPANGGLPFSVCSAPNWNVRCLYPDLNADRPVRPNRDVHAAN